jgi:tRNA nucleotidyltransferase (CCA-adding enzyme)
MALFPKNIPTGLQHGTVTVCMGEGTENHFEITTFRIDGEYTDGRRPETVVYARNLLQDLARRDFTINAMAHDSIINLTIDPYRGYDDLQKKIIRAVGDANARFQEDGLRIMRAARFAARFGYGIEDKTLQGMKDNLGTLQKVSKERISDELSKTLTAQYPSIGITHLINCSALDITCPLLADKMAHSRFMPVLPKLDPSRGELSSRLAFLYSEINIKLVGQELLDLKFSNREIKDVLFLLRAYEAFLDLQQNDNVVSYRKFVASFQNEYPATYGNMLYQFIAFVEPLGLPATEILSKYRTIVWSRKDLTINGDDLMTAGVPAGKIFKVLLDRAYQEILEHPEHNEKEYLLQMLLRD